jgi:hypothetical protein
MAATDPASPPSQNGNPDCHSSSKKLPAVIIFMSKKSPKKSAHALVRISLQFDLPEAVSVNIAGSFNDWNPVSLPMERKTDGRWECAPDLPAGRHEFRLVIDGVWSDVPNASETVENAFGSRNAVLIVAKKS